MLKSEVVVAGLPVYVDIRPGDFEEPTGLLRTQLRGLGTLEKIGIAATSIIGNLYQHMEPALTGEGSPSEVQVDFGMSLGGDEGVPYLSRGSHDGNFRISAVWKIQ